MSILPAAKLGALASEAGKVLENFVNAFLDFGKILIAAVNGPAIGIAVTTLGLCDFVFCSDLATFQTPFSRLGQSPEGCSSYVFPRIMGISKANELLIMGKVFSAQDALHSGLVSEVFPGSTFFSKVKSLAELIASFPKDGLLESKKVFRIFSTLTTSMH